MKFCVVFLILFVQLGNAQKSPITPKMRQFKNDTVVWKKDSFLVKENFKSKTKGNYLGLTYTGILLYPTEDNGNLIFYIQAIVVKSKSYLKDFSPYVLKHEQLHFDITELYARKLRKIISEKDFKKVKNVQEQITKMYTKVNDELQKEQNKYDEDTEHGINSAKQKVWSEKIAQELIEYEPYSVASIDIANK